MLEGVIAPSPPGSHRSWAGPWEEQVGGASRGSTPEMAPGLLAPFHCQDLSEASHGAEAGRGAVLGIMKDDSK